MNKSRKTLKGSKNFQEVTSSRGVSDFCSFILNLARSAKGRSHQEVRGKFQKGEGLRRGAPRCVYKFYSCLLLTLEAFLCARHKNLKQSESEQSEQSSKLPPCE